ncbi:hypothetical protein C2S51_027969 [Perilla frutescens var. frutescens]|nr:hypothetical protein C2S51_027969 [Perilla frutescens var. frutescens]
MPGSSNKCFSAILSRLLCSGGLPTHPSEQFNESSSVKLEIVPKCSESSAKPPGVVARLMGLESFPASSAPPKERTLGDFFRSRSVNSIDFLSHFDPLKHGTPRHRRVRTSLSFREGRISDEFTNVVLLFEEELLQEEEKRREINHGKKVHEIQEKRKSVYRKKVGIEGKRKPDFEKKELQGKIRGNLKERRPLMKCEEELKKKKMKKNSKILAHKLNCDFKKIHPQGTAPEVVRRATRTKNQPYQTANSQTESSCSNSAVFSENVVVRGKNERKLTKIDENFCNKKMVEEICLVSEEDIVRENYWINGMELKFDDFEEICQLFGQEILQVLLKQFVDDLVLNFSQ